MKELSVAILAGGKSTRMGRDKALMEWGDQQLIDLVISIGLAIEDSHETFIVGDRPEYHGRGVRVIEDRYRRSGPLGGIATALHESSTCRVLVLAVDMPQLSLPLLNAMSKLMFSGDALVPNIDGYQPLHAIYCKRCLPVFEKQLDKGQFKVSDAFVELNIAIPDREWISSIDPQLRSFSNANTPDEYQELRTEHRII